MEVDILDGSGRSPAGDGEYNPRTGLLLNVNVRPREESLDGQTVSLVSKDCPTIIFMGNLTQAEGGFLLAVNPQT